MRKYPYLLFFFHILITGCSQVDENMVFDFSENLPAALYQSQTIEPRQDGNEKKPSSPVQQSFLKEDAIFQAPLSSLNYFVSIPENAILKFGIVIENKFKDKNRFYDFEIFAKKQNSAPERIFLKRITAEDSGFFRQWMENEVDMRPYAGEIMKLSFKLSTNSEVSKGNVALGWGRPALVSTVPLVAKESGRKEESKKDKITKLPNIIIYLADALRADHIGCYGYEKMTSPHIDEFALDGILFENAVSQAGWTQPAVASIFTGLYPSSHRVTNIKNALNENFTTMAELLKEKGYITGAFIKNPLVSQEVGFSQGFDTFRLVKHAERENLTQLAADWVANSGSSPFFLYVHALNPHEPYDPPKTFYEKFAVDYSGKVNGKVSTLKALKNGKWPEKVTEADIEYLISLYDAEIAHADDAFGRFMDALKKQGMHQDSLIIFMADHGEEFYDHGSFSHGQSLYSELTHIPLILKLPGNSNRGKRASGIARQIDIIPTVMDIIGSPTSLGDGQSLTGQLEDTASNANVLGISEQGALRSAVIYNGYKLIKTRGEKFEFYNLLTDPREKNNIFGADEVMEGYLGQALFKRQMLFQEATKQEKNVELSKDLKKQMKSLGYLQ
ncbi:MAG: sulfatase [Nitrospinae bacterium]|nr:sulfatase [Nitrospinota bacterium]